MFTDKKIIGSWFSDHQKPDSSIEVRAHVLDEDKSSHLEDFMVNEIPNCYIKKNELSARINETGLSASEILQNKLPDTGNVMSGDFGEILTLFYLGSERREALKTIKKWRFKQDRKKATPHSDVIILYRKYSDRASKMDYVICAESKAKATGSNSEPIENSIKGYEADKTGRMARTLVWLKEKAIDHENKNSISFIKRFTDDHLKTGFNKKYRAVAIIDRNYLDNELIKSLDLPAQNDEFEIIVLGINNLKDLYEQSFSRAINEVTND